ncbi:MULTISPECIES: potassium channel family protein [Methylobacterium]|jgi:voltage-gated potassium channel|uniref:Voltage-gated potassium channel n=1 Tax=Methylobacterium brachiatum TaxID=269660 RepID=A0AAJ1TN67_9HYPH|nr:MULTISPECIES: potassium channel family protein [Methylobacterium]KNY24215.1 ion transporter [Methylobacterium sp. ARG-1]MCB4803252.1 potassium channel family protein [Methylobacterium brachiatum]MDF2597301.1 ion transporter [Methylobacterium brachiatum]MDH2308761.1 potassium channel family protein [Methylobacterium brachiatum]MDQ0543980.1 voltage-gated potassium channel [Methylobacterium brachiatum]
MTRAATTLRELYEGDTRRAHRFRYGLLVFDVATVAFVIVTSFLPLTSWIIACDVALGVCVLLDFAARLGISRAPLREFRHLSTWADVVAVASFLAPVIVEGVGFLRILRTLRLLRTYHLLERLRQDSAVFRRNEDAILAATNLVVFVFTMTGIVYATQHGSNPAIQTPVDALYFTVTSLTTTGYGDITLPGPMGRLLSVFVMICGVTLFFRLAQVVFRPYKVRFPCDACGLMRHEPDAVHCKACGNLLNIPDEGGD